MSITGDTGGEGYQPITPPSTIVEPPLSPPATDEKVRSPTVIHTVLNPLLQRFLLELNVDPLTLSYPLSPGIHATAKEHLAKSAPEVSDYIENKLRYDLVNDRLIIIRMPTFIHEIVSRKLVDTLHNRLQLFCSNTINSDTKRLIEAIQCLGSARVKFSKTWHREPDQQLKLELERYPGTVIECAHTQSGESLAKAAEDYTVESLGDIQIVIGIETNPSSRAVYLSTWAPSFDIEGDQRVLSNKKIIDRDIVRDEQGNFTQGELTINLGHLAPARKIRKRFPQAKTDLTVSISYEEIAGFVREGELEQELEDQYVEAGEADIDEETRNIKKRRRESSEDELLSADERNWRHREEKAIARSEASDKDYVE